MKTQLSSRIEADWHNKAEIYCFLYQASTGSNTNHAS